MSGLVRIWNGIPSMWPWLIADDEPKTGWRLLERAEKVWPSFKERQLDIAEYMVMHHEEFWPACVAVLANGDGLHICPRCGHQWVDPTK